MSQPDPAGQPPAPQLRAFIEDQVREAVTALNRLLGVVKNFTGNDPAITVAPEVIGQDGEPIPQLSVIIQWEPPAPRRRSQAKKLHWFSPMTTEAAQALLPPGRMLTSCGRLLEPGDGSAEAWRVTQSGHACQICLNRIWDQFPDLREQEKTG